MTDKRKEKMNLDDLQGIFQHLKLEMLTLVHALEKSKYSK